MWPTDARQLAPNPVHHLPEAPTQQNSQPQLLSRGSDVSVLASCQSLHTLNLSGVPVSDVSVLASCQSLHTLNLSGVPVSDVFALASCQSLH
jgi:Leucine-rich repeat (LRR) protein